jgi:hypothetical protein
VLCALLHPVTDLLLTKYSHIKPQNPHPVGPTKRGWIGRDHKYQRKYFQ